MWVILKESTKSELFQHVMFGVSLLLPMFPTMGQFIFCTLLSIHLLGTANINLHKPHELSPLRREILGINLNYLVDGEMLAPIVGQSLAEGLQELGVRNLRYPGGNKSDSFLWSVPPYSEPNPRLAVQGEWDWPAMEKRFWNRETQRFTIDILDPDEVLTLNARLGTDLIVVVPYDEAYANPTEVTGRHEAGPSVEWLIKSAVAWARYSRARGQLPRYWEIGNESYFHEGITIEQYTKDFIRFAKALHAVDRRIRVGANGPDSGDKLGYGDSYAATGKKWWPTLLKRASKHIDYLSLHDYPCYGWKGYEAYEKETPDVLTQLANVRETVDKNAAKKDRERIELLVTETNSADWLERDGWPHKGNIGHALVLFDMLGQYLQYEDVRVVQIWNTRWVDYKEKDELWDALTDDNSVSVIGQAMELWQRAGTHWLKATQTSGIRCFATWEPSSNRVNVFLINRTLSPQKLSISGEMIGKRVWVTSWRGDGPDDEKPSFSKETEADPSQLAVPPAGLLILQN
jgi:alpha-N-arabinofuranosidase